MVIPKKMRPEILDRLHYNHLGIEKTLLRARELVYWPFMSKEITNVIKSCPACLVYQNSNTKEPMASEEIPDRPWHTVAADLFRFEGQEYLLIVDYYSRYPEVCCLKYDTTYKNMIHNVKSIFARHGKPEIL